jgi:hypothetical protein
MLKLAPSAIVFPIMRARRLDALLRRSDERLEVAASKSLRCLNAHSRDVARRGPRNENHQTLGPSNAIATRGDALH